jgi:hypothetical protein
LLPGARKEKNPPSGGFSLGKHAGKWEKNLVKNKFFRYGEHDSKKELQEESQ